MTSNWQTVRLGDVLQRVKAELTIDDSVTYKQVTVRLWNKGVILRGEQEGITIKTKRQFYVKADQLLLSRIDVRNGAIGLVPKELDGAIVSNDFWAYDFNENKLFPKYLAYYVTIPSFIEEASRTSSGTTQRIRAEETSFLNINIPLPPIDEQRRIIEYIETLAARISKAQSLREAASEETKRLPQSILRYIFNKENTWKSQKLDEVAPISMGQSPSGDSYNFDNEGVPLLNGPTEFGERHPTPRQWTVSPTKFCKTGDILICVRGATTGKMNWADQEYCIGRGLAALSADNTKCVPEYVYYFVRTQTQEILSRTAGSTFPNLPGDKLKTLPIPVPSLDEQRRIVAYLDGLQAKVDELWRLQSESERELSALMPSILDRAFKGEL